MGLPVSQSIHPSDQAKFVPCGRSEAVTEQNADERPHCRHDKQPQDHVCNLHCNYMPGHAGESNALATA
jgi:hypothetical protein